MNDIVTTCCHTACEIGASVNAAIGAIRILRYKDSGKSVVHGDLLPIGIFSLIDGRLLKDGISCYPNPKDREDMYTIAKKIDNDLYR
jgi:hypothetical protein